MTTKKIRLVLFIPSNRHIELIPPAQINCESDAFYDFGRLCSLARHFISPTTNNDYDGYNGDGNKTAIASWNHIRTSRIIQRRIGNPVTNIALSSDEPSECEIEISSRVGGFW